ncbi:MAG: hypothetical protein NZL95_00260 [Chitinophagales bacterium]|nr:hypothetical protein [Chitinophagales bacterium]MDW8426973.1 hypothetical protein [Chitinophagales bacterium]
MLFCLFAFTAHAQRPYTLHIKANGKDSLLLARQFSYRKDFPDTLSRRKEVEQLMRRLYDAGYLEAAPLSLHVDSLQLIVHLHIGSQWKWVTLRPGNVDPLVLRRAGFRLSDFTGKPVSPSAVFELLEGLVAHCENHGYPFAVATLDSLRADSSGLHAALSLNLRQRIQLEGIDLNGNVRISTSFLEGYLGLNLPQPYKESLILQAGQRLQQLPYLTLTAAPQVLFVQDRARLVLALQRKNASRVNVVLGLLPNSLPGGRLLLTGEADLDLRNSFGRGEQLRFSFSRLNTRSAQTLLQGEYPYPFRLPFGAEGSFYLLRNDSQYVDVRLRGGVKYFFDANRFVRFYAGRNTVSIISLDTMQIIQTLKLPPYLDSRESLLGAELFYRQGAADGISKGWMVQLGGQVGNRRIVPNATITQLHDPEHPQFSFASLYDSFPQQQPRLLVQGQVEGILPVFPRQSLRLVYAGAYQDAPTLLLSDLFRLGGFQRLRGFDELSIFASHYHLVTAEYRVVLLGRSYLYGFLDGAYVENRLEQPPVRDWPLGFGAGISFETKSGLFGVNYAVGRQRGNPIQFRSAKIHFGYINYF